MARGMQEECLGGLFLPPTPPQFPRGKPARLSASWALGCTERNGLGAEHSWGWGVLGAQRWVYV